MTWRASRKYSLSFQGSGTLQKHRELTWRCLPLIWEAFIKANTTPNSHVDQDHSWLRFQFRSTWDVSGSFLFRRQQIRHAVKWTRAQRQRTSRITARELLHPLIFKKWPWSRSKILETQRKKNCTANAPVVPVLWIKDSSVHCCHFCSCYECRKTQLINKVTKDAITSLESPNSSNN